MSSMMTTVLHMSSMMTTVLHMSSMMTTVCAKWGHNRIRTYDTQNHNLMFYQLNYMPHMFYAEPRGVEPRSQDFQSRAYTKSAKVPIELHVRLELTTLSVQMRCSTN